MAVAHNKREEGEPVLKEVEEEEFYRKYKRFRKRGVGSGNRYSSNIKKNKLRVYAFKVKNTTYASIT